MTRSMVLLMAGLLVTAACRDRGGDTGTTETPNPETSAPAGVDVTGVALGKAVGGDNAVIEATTTFDPTDTIYVSVRTTGTAPSATLTARWTFEDGQVVDETSQTIAPTGSEVTEFHISKPDGWPAGSYEVAISLDGEPVETQSFTVEG